MKSVRLDWRVVFEADTREPTTNDYAGPMHTLEAACEKLSVFNAKHGPP